MEKINIKPLSFSGISVKAVVFQMMAWLAISCGGLLYVPRGLLSAIHLDTWVSEHAHFFGLGLMVSLAYLLSQLLNYFLDEAIGYWREKRLVEVIDKKVKLLDSTERALLREFFLQGETILTLPEDQPAVKSLVEARILQNLGNQKHYAIQSTTAEFKISMKAREHLNRQVLRFPEGKPTEAEMETLIKARPTFINHYVAPRKHAA